MRRALLLALAVLALPLQAADLKPFSASYTADWKQLPMSGTAERSLVKNANGTWDLNFKASMMIASLTEQSTLRLDNDTLLPQKYHFERGGLGKAKKVDLDFDWSSKKVTGSDVAMRSTCRSTAVYWTSRPTSWRCSMTWPPARRA